MTPLYHGTCTGWWDMIQKTGFLMPAPRGDMHVSFTTDPTVAAYAARNAVEVYSDHGPSEPVILETTREALDAAGHETFAYVSGETDEYAWEAEVATRLAVSTLLLRVSDLRPDCHPGCAAKDAA